jgi:hypothetical protein
MGGTRAIAKARESLATKSRSLGRCPSPPFAPPLLDAPLLRPKLAGVQSRITPVLAAPRADELVPPALKPQPALDADTLAGLPVELPVLLTPPSVIGVPDFVTPPPLTLPASLPEFFSRRTAGVSVLFAKHNDAPSRVYESDASRGRHTKSGCGVV